MNSRMQMLIVSRNHWEKSTERFDLINFERWVWGFESGLPVSYSDLEKFYLNAGCYCNVGECGYDIGFWQQSLGFDNSLEDFTHFETAIIKSSYIPVRFYESYKNYLM